MQVNLVSCLFLIMVFSSLIPMTVSGEEQDLVLDVDVEEFRDQLKCGIMYEPAYLNWTTNNGDDPSIRITIELRQDRSDWLPVAYKVHNFGSILLDPETSGIPNGNDYRIKISAEDGFGNSYHEVLGQNLSIWMGMEPEVELHLNTADETACGILEISWELQYLYGVDTDISIILTNWKTDEILQDLEITYEGNTAYLVTTGMRNDQWFIASIIINTGLGFNINDSSDPFRIFNEEMLGPGFMNLEAGDVLWDQFEIWCSPHPHMTKWSDMLSDLHIIEVASQESVYTVKNWEGEFSKTLDFRRFTQGAYDLIYLSRSLKENFTFKEQLRVFIADRSIPVIDGLRMDSKYCDEDATIIWASRGTEISNDQHFNVMVQYQNNMDDWVDICNLEDDPGIVTIDSSGMEPGNYNLRLTVYNRYYPWLKDERVVTGVVIHHIGPPEFTAVLCPGRTGNVSGDVTLEWKIEDDPSEEIHVFVYHRSISEDWRYVTERAGNRGSITWNSSEAYTGTYQFKLVAYDNSKDNLSCTWITHEFNVSGIEVRDPMGSSSDDRTWIKQQAFNPGPVVSLLILLVPVLVLVIFMIVKRRRSPEKDGTDGQPFNIGPEAINVIERKQRMMSQDALPGMGRSSAPRMNTGPVNGDKEDPIDHFGSQMEDILTVIGQNTNIDLKDEDLMSYSILGVTERATDDEIKRAHRDFARRYHPDRFNSMNENLRKKAEEEMKRRNRAKEILLDPMKKAVLDKRLRDDPTVLIRRKISP